jgi:hypothetical protein
VAGVRGHQCSIELRVLFGADVQAIPYDDAEKEGDRFI